jgi:hypothetical protein
LRRALCFVLAVFFGAAVFAGPRFFAVFFIGESFLCGQSLPVVHLFTLLARGSQGGVGSFFLLLILLDLSIF